MTQDEMIELARQAGFAEPERIISTDTVRCVPDLAYFAELIAEKAFEEGFYAGFKASGEGWNGECPFNDLGLDIQQNESVQHELKEAIKARG